MRPGSLVVGGGGWGRGGQLPRPATQNTLEQTTAWSQEAEGSSSSAAEMFEASGISTSRCYRAPVRPAGFIFPGAATLSGMCEAQAVTLTA